MKISAHFVRPLLFAASIVLSPVSGRAEDSRPSPASEPAYLHFLGQPVGEESKTALYDFSYAGYNQGNPDAANGADWGEAPRFGRQQLPVFEVEAPDESGAVDNTERIQTAINEAQNSATGGVVLLKPGTYWIRTQSLPPGYDQRRDGLPADWPVIRIRGHPHSQPIILRGAGSGPGGTVIRAKHELPNFAPRDWKIGAPYVVELGSRPPFVDPVQAPSGPQRLRLAQDAPVGTKVVKLRNPGGPHPFTGQGQPIRLTMHNDPVRQQLLKELISPLQIEPEWFNTVKYNPLVSFAALVDEVVQEGEITVLRIRAPLPHTLRADDLSRASAEPLFSSFRSMVAVEDLRIATGYDGRYAHHSDQEDDYHWRGLRATRLYNSWIRNVAFETTNNSLTLNDCFAVTVEDCRGEGTGEAKNPNYDGHFGFQLTNASYCLVRRVHFESHPEHMVSISNATSACVFSEIVNASRKWPRGDLQHSGEIDSHGALAPNTNLFERMHHFVVSCGGAPENVPHSGKNNVFWNIQAGPFPRLGVDDFFSWTWYNYRKAGDRLVHDADYCRKNNHRLFPRSIIVGIRAYGPSALTIGGSSEDRNQPFSQFVSDPGAYLYVNGLNTKDWAEPQSLYGAQLARRRAAAEAAK